MMISEYRNTVRCLYLKECELIESSVEAAFGVSRSDIVSVSRYRNIVEARMALFSLFRQYFRISANQLGAIYNKDHSTIFYNLKMCEDMKKFDRVFNCKFCSAEAFVQERLSVIKSEVLLERNRNRCFLWYCVNPDGSRKMFFDKPRRAENYWQGRLVHIDDRLMELFSDRAWEDDPIMVELRMIDPEIQEEIAL